MKKDLMGAFECKLEGELTEYMGRKIEVTWKENGFARIKFTQLVLLQKLKNDFLVPILGKVQMTQAVGWWHWYHWSKGGDEVSIQDCHLYVCDAVESPWNLQSDQEFGKKYAVS